nr:reverse transcriptase domain-containing protein [Tanacetum cinerariifolium]
MRFQQRFDESFYEAWDCFNDLLRACPHHGFFELHQLDTFYNALNVNDQDSLNSAAGGNFLDKMPRECLKIIESKSKVRQSRAKAFVAKVSTSSSTPAISSDVAELKDMVRALLLDKKNQSSAPDPSLTPAPVKAVEPNYVTCGGAHSYQNCPATNENIYRDNIQDASMPNLKSSIPYPSRRDNERRRDQVNEQIEKFYEIFKDMSFKISFTDALILMPKFASTLKALIRNKEKLRMDECLALADLGASINLMPLSVWEALLLPELTPTCMTLELADRSVSKPIGIAKDVSVKVGVFHFPADFMVVDFEPDPRVPLILGRCFLKTGRALIDVHKGELTLRIRNEAITYKLDQTSRYFANYNQMTANKIDVIDLACEEYSQEVLGFSDVTASGNPTPYDDLIVSTTSPTLTSFGDSDFLLFEEADTFLSLEDDPNSLKINPFYYDPEGDILLLDAILNSKPLPHLPNHEQYLPSFKKELKVCEAKTVKSFVNEPPEVELKDLPPHLEYVFLEGNNKLPVIIAKELGDEEISALIKVLKSHKRAIAWKLSDILGINPEFCTHKILMEENYKPAVQHQRRVNPKIHDVIKKEVKKLLDAGLIYPISDSPWVSPGTEVTNDQVQTPSSQSTAPVQPLVIRSETQTPVSEPVVAPVCVPMPNLKPSIPYPSRHDNERRRDQANEQIEKFYEIFKDMMFKISFTDALILMPKFASTLKALIGNKEKLSEMARTPMNEHCLEVILNKLPRKLGDPDKKFIPCEFQGMDECLALADLGTGRALIDVHKGELTLHIRNEAITYNLDQTVRYSANYNQMMANKIDVICKEYSQEVLGSSDVTTSGNPTPYDNPIVSTTSHTLTPFGDSAFLLFEEADAFLGLEDDPIDQ